MPRHSTPRDDTRPQTSATSTDPSSASPSTTFGLSERVEAWLPGRGLAALGGVAAAVAGLGVAELVSGMGPSLSSPVLAIGERIVDAVPQPVKQLAIDTFGTADKIVLVLGIVIVVVVAAAGIGIVARRHRAVAAGVTGVLAATAAGAALAAPTARAVAAIPATTAGLIAIPTLLALTTRRQVGFGGPGPSTTDGDTNNGAETPSTTIARRRFLAMSGGALALGIVGAGGGRALDQRRAAVASRSTMSLPAPTAEAPAIPATAHPRVAGLSPFLTPNSDFYRIDTALAVPRLSSDGWTLRIHGLVDRAMTFGYDELLAMDSVDLPITLTCVSNEVGGDLVGTARWQGVRLADLLDRAGVQANADQLVGRAHDGWTAGFPVEAAYDRDTLVAFGMNGEPLPAAHGFPLRLVTPGLYGYVSATKWLTDVEVTTFDAFDQYWVARGWVEDAPVKVASRIDTPTGLATVQRGTVAVAGVAWAQTRGISQVEVQVDDGEFQPAQLADEVSADTWRQWVFGWDTGELAPGRHQLTVRATGGDGVVQDEARMPPFPSGATGWHSLAVIVAGE